MNNSALPVNYKQMLRKRFSIADVAMIAVNLIPVAGVWFWNWDAKEVFLIYCLETIIVGLFTIVEMFITARHQKRSDNITPAPKAAFVIPFFIMHYGMFVVIQLSVFLGVIDIPGLENEFLPAFVFLANLDRYLENYVFIALACFVLSYGLATIRNHISSGQYRNINLMVLMFKPYPRIFIQQFVVIFGAFILSFAASKLFILLFVIVKLLFEVAVDYDKFLVEAQRLSESSERRKQR